MDLMNVKTYIKYILECKDADQSSNCDGFKSAGWCTIDAVKDICMLTCEVCGKYVKFNFLAINGKITFTFACIS